MPVGAPSFESQAVCWYCESSRLPSYAEATPADSKALRQKMRSVAQWRLGLAGMRMGGGSERPRFVISVLISASRKPWPMAGRGAGARCRAHGRQVSITYGGIRTHHPFAYQLAGPRHS